MKRQLFILSGLVSILGFGQEKSITNKSKEKSIDEVTITKSKKAIEHKSDRVIFDFSEQPNLNTGTVLEGMKKLPGLMISDFMGMSYQGRTLNVYMDNQPLNITGTELNAFLEGLPANSIEKIEIITNAGAKFEATSGGVVLNIITSRSAKNYLTATYSGNYSFSNEKEPLHKTNQSVLLNAKNKSFSWQVNLGGNYRENLQNIVINDITNLVTDKIDRSYFARTAFRFDLGQDGLLLNYNMNYNHNDEDNASTGILGGLNYLRKDLAETKRWRNEAMATYQKRFLESDKKLDLKFYYTQSKRNFGQENDYFYLNHIKSNVSPYGNINDTKTMEFSINYEEDINVFDMGKISMGGLYNRTDYETRLAGLKNLDYNRNTYATFAELQTTKGKLDFVIGIRAEGYDIGGETYNLSLARNESLRNFKKFRFFPNASVKYNISQMVNMSMNYNHKIELPFLSQLDPNSGYTNGSLYNVGNVNISPTLYHNFGAKISAFNYFFVGYDLSLINNDIVQQIIRMRDTITMSLDNVSSVKSHSFSMGIPFSLSIFNKPMKEVIQTNPDKTTFFYFVGAYNQNVLPNKKNKGLFYFNINGHIALPKQVMLGVNYTIIPKGGDYYYFRLNENLENALNLTLSKKFLDNRLNISLFANDVFNSNRGNFITKQEPVVNVYYKSDSRNFGISVNYKIPTSNSLARENRNMFLESKEQEKGGFIK